MERYKIQSRVETITQNKKITDTTFGGWMAINIGTADCTVLGITLAPSEGLDMTNAVPAGSNWDSPIDITVQPGGAIRLIRLQYKRMKEA